MSQNSSAENIVSLFWVSPPVAALTRLLPHWWGRFIYLFFEGHWEEPGPTSFFWGGGGRGEW